VAGPGTYAGPTTIFQTYSPLDRVELGGYCSIANDVRVVLPGGRFFDDAGNQLALSLRGSHRPESASSFPIGILVPDEPYDEPPPDATGERLVIGDDVWIGYGATILGNITVGTGSIVGARALVQADVPPYSVVGGVPAKVLRKRFDDDVVEAPAAGRVVGLAAGRRRGSAPVVHPPRGRVPRPLRPRVGRRDGDSRRRPLPEQRAIPAA
jgi:acetyltransferase-like isoleucine patch superfamily enzyme